MSEVLEKDVENYLFRKQEVITVNGKEVFITEQQVKVGDYYIDLLGQDDEYNIYVIELKRGIIDGNALSQVLFYMDYVSLYNSKTKYCKKIYGVLIGNGITTYMENALGQLNNIFYFEYEQSFSFKEETYDWSKTYLASETFKNDSKLFNNLTIGEERDIDEFEREELERFEKEKMEAENNGTKKNV